MIDLKKEKEREEALLTEKIKEKPSKELRIAE
jgi:hypothetical protein